MNLPTISREIQPINWGVQIAMVINLSAWDRLGRIMQPISDKLVLFINHDFLGFSSYGLVQKWGYMWYCPMYFVWSHTQIEVSTTSFFTVIPISPCPSRHARRLLDGDSTCQSLAERSAPWTSLDWGWWDPCSSGPHSIHRTTLPAFWN